MYHKWEGLFPITVYLMKIKFVKTISILLVLSALGFLVLRSEFFVQDEVRYVKEWYGKKLIFPEQMTFRLYGKESVDYDYSTADYKILALMDSVSCIECQLRIDDWKRFITDVDSLTNANIRYLFVMKPVSERNLYDVLKDEDFQIPVCTDASEFRKINKMEFPGTHVFLLDQNNQIICVGNPLLRKRIRELYFNLMN